MVLTDPPYGLARGYGRRGGDGEQRSIANDADLSALNATVPEMVRVLHGLGVTAVFAAPTMRRAVEEVLRAGGLEPLWTLVWDKGAAGLGYRVRYAHEEIVLAAQWGMDPWKYERDPIFSLLRCPRVQAPEHPNEKPVDLLRRLIAWGCPEGGLVVDPFAGIASSGVAAIAEGRRWVGVECDERWWDIAARRLAGASPGMGDQVGMFDGEAA